MRFSKKFAHVALLLSLFIFVSFLYTLEDKGKKVLTIKDYDRWRSIVSASISDNGNWITYSYSFPNMRHMDDTLYMKNLATGREHEIVRGSRPQFSDDSRWVAYIISLPKKEAEKLRKNKKPVPDKTQLMNLETGDKFTWNSAASFSFSKGSKFFAVKKSKSDRDAKHNGTDVILRNLKLDIEEHIGSVGTISFNKQGTLFAYTIDAADKNGNGLYVIYLNTGVRRPLDNGHADYTRMSWNEKGTALAVLKGNKKKGFIQKDNILLAFVGLIGEHPIRIEYSPADDPNFPQNMVISERVIPERRRRRTRAIERRSLFWSEDDSRLFCGIKEQEKESEKKEDAEPVANVDVWHWKNERIQSVQMAQAEADRNFTYRSAFNLKDKRFVRLAGENMRTIHITKDGKWGVGEKDKAYISDWKERRADYYRVNTATGKRTLMFKAQGRTLGLSPDSKHFLYWKDGDIWVYKIETGEKINLTKNAPVSFVNKEYDYPGTKPPYGVAGWTNDGKGVILNHRYDLWLQLLDGSKVTNLTGGLGEKEEIRFRYIRLNPKERFIDLSQPILLSAYGQWTKKAGYYELKNRRLNKLIYEDKRFSRLTKAKNADKIMYTIESFVDFPNYYVSDTKFTSPKRITDANPWQPEYKWGQRILFDYTNKDGVRLQGTLAIPDDYKPDQRLPMLVNFYEKKSQDLHRHIASRYASSFNSLLIESVSKGYLLMQPDIHFNTGATGDDMLECVEAAVKKVIEIGYADPEHIGVYGFSFSGYGAAYIATRSKMFAAVGAGAGVMNLVSDFNHLWGWSPEIQKGSGTNAHHYIIFGQQRMGTNPLDDFELHWNQSPVAHARTMDTPLLILHGIADATVAWIEAIELYNALRFLEKNVILLSYPGEGHGLSKLENRKDLTVRMLQFFDHYLMEKPAPDWMINGVPFLKKKK